MQPDGQPDDRMAPDRPEQGPVVSLSPDVDQASLDATQHAESMPEVKSEGAEPIRWQASEYIHREKDQVWFVLFGIVTVVLIGVAALIIESLTFTVLVLVMAVALAMYSRRPPRMLDYTLGRHGLYINDQLFPFGDFKSFALVRGIEQYSIMLVPVKRFKPAVTINFPDEVGEAIVDMLAARLPMRQVEPDLVDRIIHKLHL